MYPYTLNKTDCYWLGFLWADGCVYKDKRCNSHKLGVHLKESDLAHLNKLKSWLQKYSNNIVSIYKVKKTMGNKTYFGYNLSLYDSKFCFSLIKLGIIKNKSKLPDFPIINSIPIKHLIHFWRGVIDGDGTCSYQKKSNRFYFGICGNYKCCEAFRIFIINNLGIKTDKKLYAMTRIFDFRLHSFKAKMASQLFYKKAPIYLERKYQSVKFITNNFTITKKREVRV